YIIVFIITYSFFQLKLLKMMNSVFVPNVFGFNVDEMKVLMEKYFGKVSDIDYILTSNGYWQAFVHFQSWHDREIVYKAIKTMEQGKAWKLRIPEKDTLVMLKNHSKKEDKAVLDSETKRDMLLKILHPTESPISEHSGSKTPRVNYNFKTKVVDAEYVEKIEKELVKARTRITELESSYKKNVSKHTYVINEIRMLDDAKTEYDRIHNEVPMFRNLVQRPIPSPKSPDYPPPSIERERKDKRITELLAKAEEKLEEVILREEGEVDEDNVSTCVHYPDTPEIEEEVTNNVKRLSLHHPDELKKEKIDRLSQCLNFRYF
ncbi:MAG: hypothetical protein WAO78_10505, partial [Roseovarius sp.]